jgi:ribonuclease T1
MALVMAVVLVLALASGLIATLSTGSDDAPTTDIAVDGTVPATEQVSDLPPIAVADLPREALESIALVSQGGPFPYPQDGSTFQNRESLLPAQPRGYYREYTVPTPGEDDRGPRRIVVGAGGEVFYTDDHYASFSEVVGGGG